MQPVFTLWYFSPIDLISNPRPGSSSLFILPIFLFTTHTSNMKNPLPSRADYSFPSHPSILLSSHTIFTLPKQVTLPRPGTLASRWILWTGAHNEVYELLQPWPGRQNINFLKVLLRVKEPIVQDLSKNDSEEGMERRREKNWLCSSRQGQRLKLMLNNY